MEPFDAKGFMQALVTRGWRWSETWLLVHPDDHDLSLRYDPVTDRLTVSPQLDERLKLVVPTPAKSHRR